MTTNTSILLILPLFLMSCNNPPMDYPESGVSESLAQSRVAQLADVSYDLHFQIPEETTESIPGRIQYTFTLSDTKSPVILDFRAESTQLKAVKKGEKEVAYEFVNDHIIIPPRFLEKGKNQFQVEFTAGDLSLNRSPEYLYTLFVPDRASTAFPCFDQPNIKARYKLALDIPSNWVAVANGKTLTTEVENGRKRYEFAETLPISTYLFAFAAGKFQQKTASPAGREMTMFFRETDSLKVANNADEVFELHAKALAWLENYTGIPYAFEKFDFVLIPTFQYGGMEHVGNIFYKEPSLFLDPSATENQKLGRASLIAHETAHMWFGDLVTMDWFSDVWLKEVFANFMAAKMVNPSFPEINHDLRFIMAHQPAAYGEDRSEGSHPIQQKLENLKDAGTLYGRIIYQKAPVVMQQLEQLIGEEDFREGLQEYLRDFSFGNATWDDLIGILDKKTDRDLYDWSQVWVKEPGMPVWETDLEIEDGKISALSIQQKKTSPEGNYWSQYTELALIYTDSVVRIPVQLEGAETTIDEALGQPAPEAILVNASKMSYGYFTLSEKEQNFLLDHVSKLNDPLLRGAAWMSLYEACLNQKLAPQTLLEKVMQALPLENETLNRQNLLGYIQMLYWKFLDKKNRVTFSKNLETLLWRQMEKAATPGVKSAYFKTYQSIALSEEAVFQLIQVWNGDDQIEGLSLSEADLTDLACELALRGSSMAASIVETQLASMDNPDRHDRLKFIQPALSRSQEERDAFFESLKQSENRHYEPWVVDALHYLHHPLRAKTAEKYILPSLELMEEIQATGDIFFPRRWITATLSGHQSPQAAQTVRQFLEERPDYPYRLKNKILMAGDLLFRVAED